MIYSGIERLYEALAKEEIKQFESSIYELEKVYESQFAKEPTLNLTKTDFIKSQNLAKYFEFAKTIIGLSNKHHIFLDRPFDGLSCFVLGIYNTYNPIKI